MISSIERHGVVLTFEYSPPLHPSEQPHFSILKVEGSVPEELDAKKFMLTLEEEAYEYARASY
jgi:hypothetical protein